MFARVPSFTSSGHESFNWIEILVSVVLSISTFIVNTKSKHSVELPRSPTHIHLLTMSEVPQNVMVGYLHLHQKDTNPSTELKF